MHYTILLISCMVVCATTSDKSFNSLAQKSDDPSTDVFEIRVKDYSGFAIFPEAVLYTLEKNEVTTVSREAVTVHEYCVFHPGPLNNADFCQGNDNTAMDVERNLFLVYVVNGDDDDGLVCAGIEEKHVVYTDASYYPSPDFKNCHYKCMTANPDSIEVLKFPYYVWRFPSLNLNDTDRFEVMAGCGANMGTVLLLLCASIIS